MTTLSKPLKVAIIGTGYFGRFHYAAWQRMPDVQLVGLLTLDKQAGKEFQATFGVATVFENLEALLSADVDLVDIVSPPSTHADLIKACVHQNIAVVCQKPFCSSVAEAQETVKLIRQQNAFVAVHENFRFQPWYEQIKHVIDTQQLGEVYEIQFNFRPGDGQGKRAYLERQPYFQSQSRFFIQETGIHFIDVFRFLLGDITGLFARLTKLNPVIAGEDAGVVLVSFANGSRGVLNGNRLSDHAAVNPRLTMGEMRIDGAKGTLTLNGDGAIYIRHHGSTELIEHQYHWQDIDFGGDCVYRTNRHIAQALRNGTNPQNSAAEYLTNRLIEAAVYESDKTGQWIDV